MLGIRPGWLRTHRKAQRPAIGAFRAVDNASIFLSNKIPFPSTTLCPPPHACPTQATLVTNPENNPFIHLRPCWTGHAALRRPLPRSSPRLASVALHRLRRAFCAAMIVEKLNWRSRRNTKSKARCALRNRKFRRVAYRHRVTHLGRPFRGDVGIVRESNAQSTQNTATRSLSVDSRFVRDWTYSAYAGRPCGYRLCASRC
jgi:hypothetical protein